MADMTLCSSQACQARDRCKRNSACSDVYPTKADNQSYAIWYPAAGPSCPGFIDYRKDWRHE